MDFMFSIIGFVLFIFLVVRVSSLSTRVTELEKRLRTQSAENLAPVAPSGTVPVSMPATAQPVPVTLQKTDTVAVSEAPNQVVEWLKNNWLSKVGVLLVLIGFGWFVSYAFVHNWIGPVGRIALGMGLGSVLALIGAWRIGKNSVQGNTLLVLGSAMVLLTAYAGRLVYDFFSPETILGLAFLVSACISTLSMMYNSEKLAIYGVLVALAAPLLTHAPEPSVIGLFTYLAVVSVASIWVSVAKGWGTVNFAAVLGVLLYSMPFVLGSSGSVLQADKAAIVVITSFLSLMFFAVNILQILKTGEREPKSSAYIAIANAVLIFSVIHALIVQEMQSIVLAGWMIIFAIGSTIVALRTRNQTFFYLYALIAIFFLGVATAIEFSGPVLAVAFSLEAAIITVMTFLATKDLLKSAYMSLLMIIPSLLALQSLMSSAWRRGIFHNDALVVALVAGLLFLLGIFFVRRYLRGTHSENIRTLYLAHYWVGAFFAFAFIWLAAHAMLADDVATIISLTVYTVIGIGTYVHGVFADKKTEKYFGAVVLILVIARLLIVDVWQMPLGPRITVFIVVGVLLVSTSFIGKKKKIPPVPASSL